MEPLRPPAQETLPSPIGLKAEVLTPYTVSVAWTDTALNRNQFISDFRYYVVRYTTYASASSSSPRYRYVNASDVTWVIDGLKPNTAYEFAVQTIKVRGGMGGEISFIYLLNSSRPDRSNDSRMVNTAILLFTSPQGRRRSPWSMVASNTTMAARPSSPPRDVTVVPLPHPVGERGRRWVISLLGHSMKNQQLWNHPSQNRLIFTHLVLQ